MKPYKYRQYKLGDEEKIVELIKNNLDPQMTLEKWRWKYQDCPGGSQSFLAETGDGEIVGHLGCVGKFGLYKGKEYIFYSLVDGTIKKEFRGSNFLKDLTQKILAFNGPIYLSFPNEISVNPYRESATEIYKLPVMTKKRKFKIFKKQNRAQNLSLMIKEFKSGDENTLNKFWDNKKNELTVSVVRNYRFIKWRILDDPEKQSLYLLFSNNQMIGYFSILFKNSTIYFGDILILNEFINRDVFLDITDFCFRFEAKSINIFVSDHNVIKCLKTLKFFPSSYPYVYYRHHFDEKQPVSCYVSVADKDAL